MSKSFKRSQDKQQQHALSSQSQEQQQQMQQRLERKIEAVTADLTLEYQNRLHELPADNALTLCDYLLAMNTEINPSIKYKQTNIQTLCYLSRFHKHQLRYDQMTRDDVIMYLNSGHKAESVDPQHRYIGTYNTRRVYLQRFFKWLYAPNVEPSQRPKPPVIHNIPKLRRKEITTIKPSDLWSDEDDLLFLKYCDNKRDRAYHTISKDSSCRPSEILNLRIKDLNFIMNIDKKQYVQITVNGKTGTRNIPLVNAVPYVKDWLDNHPMGNNPNAYLIPTMDPKHHPHTKGNHMLPPSMNDVYTRHYKTEVFPRLLEDPKVPPEDKIKIKELLKKPFNPYIRRHSALTQKAQKLTAPVLRQHAGWSIGSKMDTKYLHLNGAESNDAILSEIYGFETAATLKAKKLSQAMAPKVCTNCNDANIPTAKFCRHCRMVLTYDAYEETLQEQQKKDQKVQTLEQKLEALEQQRVQEARDLKLYIVEQIERAQMKGMSSEEHDRLNKKRRDDERIPELYRMLDQAEKDGTLQREEQRAKKLLQDSKEENGGLPVCGGCGYHFKVSIDKQTSSSFPLKCPQCDDK